MKTKSIILLLLVFPCFYGTLYSQLNTVTNVDPAQTVTAFILNGVDASNVVYTGAETAFGTFSGGSTTNIGIGNGIILTTGTLSSDYTPAIGSPVTGFSTYSNSTNGDEMLNTLVSVSTYDASVLEFDLIPVGNILEFQYIFASEEYPEFVNSSFNDVFGFFVDGPNPEGGNYTGENIALLPESALYVAINNVNSGLNSEYFVDNQAVNGQTIVFDGFTTLLTAQIHVVPGNTYHLKLAIADAGDNVYDSGIFLMAQSLKSYNYSAIESTKPIAASAFYNQNTRQIELTGIVDNSEQITVSIYNIQGSIIKEKLVSGGEFIDMSELPNGVYLVKLSSAKIRKTLKLVVF